MCFQPSTLSPIVRVVVTAHVAEDDIVTVPVQDDAQVKVYPRRPEACVLGAGHPVQAEARVGDVGLQVKGGGLGRLLMFIGEPGEAGSEGVGYADVHRESFRLSPGVAGHYA